MPARFVQRPARRSPRPRRVAAWTFASALLTACAIEQPRVPVSRYLDGDYAAVKEFAERAIADGPEENLALVMNVQAQCQLQLGEVDAARRTFERAAGIMGTWATAGSEVTAAIVGSESSKTYKGDPYEKAMNALYLAYCYLQKGEPDNARAALKRGILMDAEVGDEEYQADNALLFWMAGRMSRLYGGSGADDFFESAREAHAFAIEHGARGRPDLELLAAPERGNLVLLLPIGLGPEKFADGGQRELARFRSSSHPATSAEVFVDGVSHGRPAILLDVDYQAMTRGGTAMEGIRKGKAVFKTASTVTGVVLLDQAAKNRFHNRDAARAQAIVGGSLLLLGALTSSTADVRYWPTLPSVVQVLALDVEPGPHRLVVEFLDAAGRPLPQLRHEFDIDVPEDGESWQLVSSLPSAAPPPAVSAGVRP